MTPQLSPTEDPTTDEPEAIVDANEITRVVNRWVLYRDAGDWDRFRTVWHSDGRMNATWFQGSAGDFIAASKAGRDAGVHILHSLGGTSVDVHGDRAIAQTKMVITQRAMVHDTLCDVECIGRFYDFFERRGGRWAIVLRQPIYEKDRVVAVTPSDPLPFDRDLLDSFPDGYKHLAYVQAQLGMTVERHMPGMDGAALEALYSRGRDWLQGGDIDSTVPA